MYVIIEQWQSYGTRPCQRCAALHGKEFRQGQGPQPPLHSWCRCVRVAVRVEEVAE